MIDVWLGVVAVALLAAAYVFVGARRRYPRTAAGEDTASNAAAAFARSRHELQAEAHMQRLDAATVEALEEELALSTLDEAAAERSTDHGPRQARPPLLHLLAGALAVAGLAVGLYALWGEPHAPLLAQASQLVQADADSDPEALERLRKALVERTRRLPNDADSWFFLADLHMRASDYASAAGAYAVLHDISGPNEQIDFAWAQASYLADGGTMSTTTRGIIDRALAANPDHRKLFVLLATDAMRHREFLTGARYLVRILDQPMPDSSRGVLTDMLTFARTQLDPERPFIEATINVLGQPSPWLVVFARPSGGGKPLAVVRLPARKTQTIVLDAATSMDDAHSLSSGGMVEVVAQLSDTGDANAKGPEVVSAAVDASTQPRIELTLTGKPAT